MFIRPLIVILIMGLVSSSLPWFVASAQEYDAKYEKDVNRCKDRMRRGNAEAFKARTAGGNRYATLSINVRNNYEQCLTKARGTRSARAERRTGNPSSFDAKNELARQKCNQTASLARVRAPDTATRNHIAKIRDECLAKVKEKAQKARMRKAQRAGTTERQATQEAKIDTERKALRKVSSPPSRWTEKRAGANCAQDLRLLYGETLAVVSFMGKQPHENSTTLVGLTAEDNRTEYKGQQVVVGCIYTQDGFLSAIFFNTKIANWTQPPKS